MISSKFRNLGLEFYCFIMVLILLVSGVYSVSFNFSSFNPNNDMGLMYQGDAFPAPSGIYLTMNQHDQSMKGSTGRVIFNTPMHLTNFTTNFSFVVNSQGNSTYGAGMAFFIAPNKFPLPVSSDGAGLGLVSSNQTLASSDPFIAVEFDTYQNEWDPSHDHVGININSMKSNVTTKWCSDIAKGAMHNATISYSSISSILRVEFSGFCSGTSNLEYQVDLRNVLGRNVVVGFSGETSSSLVEIHNLKSWNFTDTSRGDAKNTGLIVGVSIFSFILSAELGLILLGGYWKKRY